MNSQSTTATTSRPLILVSGSPRSGTTWVGNALQECPRTMLLMEPFNSDLSQRAARVCNVRFGERFVYVTEDNAGQFEPALKRMLDLRFDTLDRLRASRSFKDVVDVAARSARFRLSRLTTRVSIMKDPLALLSAPWLECQFGARVLVMVRHPAAIVSSFKRLNLGVDIRGFLRQQLLMRDLLGPIQRELEDFVAPAQEPDIIDQASMLWKAIHFVIREFRRLHPHWLFVRHEDLSLDPLEGFKKICIHLGLPFTPRVRRFIAASHDERLPGELDVDDAFTTTRNARKNLDNWRHRLTPGEIARIRRRVEDVAQFFYSKSEWK